MTYPRAHLVDTTNGGYYHCISRCVRQSWLCGKHAASGKSYEHRRGWIKRRIELLASVFAVDVYAYAIMSNHYHIVLRLDPKRTKHWSDVDIAQRWLKRDRKSARDRYDTTRFERLLEQPEKIEQLRQRLGSLSWFMRYINEPLARIANAEDDCSGRFWEGRFKSVALLDRTALLNCMIYVDLNPSRVAPKLALPSAHTSAKARTSEIDSPLADLKTLEISTKKYLSLLKWTSEATQSATKATPRAVHESLRMLKQTESQWLSRVAANTHWYRAYGLTDSIAQYVVKLGQNWLQIPALRII